MDEAAPGTRPRRDSLEVDALPRLPRIFFPFSHNQRRSRVIFFLQPTHILLTRINLNHGLGRE